MIFSKRAMFKLGGSLHQGVLLHLHVASDWLITVRSLIEKVAFPLYPKAEARLEVAKLGL